MVIQPDSKILISGNTNFAGTTDFAVIRLNIDGTLDMGFGIGGKFWTDINTNSEDFNPSIVLHASGKIVLAGIINASTIGLCRLNTNGTLDTGFDNDGKMTLEIDYGIDQVKGMALQIDGKVLLAGNYNNGVNDDFALIRVNGINDFSVNNGKMFSAFGFYNNAASAMSEQTDGKIILGGYSENNNTNPNGNYNGSFALARYNVDGSLDKTFDSDGLLTTFFNDYEDYCTSIALQPDGKIVAAGSSVNSSGTSDFALARYNTSGSLDNTFGTGGKVTTSVSTSNDNATSVLIQTDGKIVIGGYSVNSNNKFSLFRYNANGTSDNTFGTNGSVISAFGTSNSISKMAIQSDGKIVAVGWVKNGSNYDFAIARYTTTGVLDNTFNATGVLKYLFKISSYDFR